MNISLEPSVLAEFNSSSEGLNSVQAAECVTESKSTLSFIGGLNCAARLNISVSLAGLLEMLKPLLPINTDMSQLNRA